MCGLISCSVHSCGLQVTAVQVHCISAVHGCLGLVVLLYWWVD